MQFLVSTLLIVFGSILSYGQGVYLQLEEVNSLDVIKYYPGQTITFATNEYPDAWRKEKIVKIKPAEGLIILSTGYISAEEIHSIQRTNGGVMVLGHMFSKFGSAWLLYGTIGSITGRGYQISAAEVIIGALAVGFGWIARKLFGRKKYGMKNLYRLRIMDVRFPPPVTYPDRL